MKNSIAILLMCLVAVASAAPALPSRDAHTVLPLLKELPRPPKIAAVEEIMGPRDQDVGSGIYVLLFRLSDDSTITVGSSDGKVALWIKRSACGGDTEVIFDGEKRPNPESSVSAQPETGLVLNKPAKDADR